MIIDDHNHANYRHHDFDKTIENMDRYNIDVTWLLSCEMPLSEWDPYSATEKAGFTDKAAMPFSDVLEFKHRRPERFVIGYAPDPRDPYAIDKLDSAVETHGVQICGELKYRMMLDDWDAIDLYRYCGEKNLPVLVHLDYPIPRPWRFPRHHYWFGGGIDSLERCLELCPETTFIGHAPGFWAHISDDDGYMKASYPEGGVVPGGKVEKLMRKYKNLYCDISGQSGCHALSRDHEYTMKFIDEFQDRIMYGRDVYDNRHQEFLYSLGLEKNVLEKILSGNALRLVPLRK